METISEDFSESTTKPCQTDGEEWSIVNPDGEEDSPEGQDQKERQSSLQASVVGALTQCLAGFLAGCAWLMRMLQEPLAKELKLLRASPCAHFGALLAALGKPSQYHMH